MSPCRDLEINLCSPSQVHIHLSAYAELFLPTSVCLFFFPLASGPKSFQVSLKTRAKPRCQTEQYGPMPHPEQEQSKRTNEHPLSFCPPTQTKPPNQSRILSLASPDTPRDTPRGKEPLRAHSSEPGCAALSFCATKGKGKAPEIVIRQPWQGLFC